MSAPRPVGNPKVRATGAVLLVLGLLGYVGTVTGLDAHGSGGRIVLAVVGTVLLLLGLALVRTRTPAVASLHAGADGLTVTVAGARAVVIGWDEIDAIWLHRLSAVYGGYLLSWRAAAAAAGHPSLRAFERRTPDGARTYLIGLTGAQSAELTTTLPPAAGARFHPLR